MTSYRGVQGLNKDSGTYLQIFSRGKGIIGILENIRAILKKVRGYLELSLYGGRVYFGI